MPVLVPKLENFAKIRPQNFKIEFGQTSLECVHANNFNYMLQLTKIASKRYKQLFLAGLEMAAEKKEKMPTTSREISNKAKVTCMRRIVRHVDGFSWLLKA